MKYFSRCTRVLVALLIGLLASATLLPALPASATHGGCHLWTPTAERLGGMHPVWVIEGWAAAQCPVAGLVSGYIIVDVHSSNTQPVSGDTRCGPYGQQVPVDGSGYAQTTTRATCQNVSPAALHKAHLHAYYQYSSDTRARAVDTLSPSSCTVPFWGVVRCSVDSPPA